MRTLFALPLLLLPACMMQGNNSLSHANLPAAPALVATPTGMGCPQPATAQNKAQTPGVLEVDLTAAPGAVQYLTGQTTAVWAYNGQVPGPTLRAKVGDTLVVHLKNDLPEATSIHWHGLRVPNALDGAVEVPAGETFTYTFKLLDTGTCWYHPHVRTSVQVERGLYGAIVVDDVQPPQLNTVADEILALDDVLLSTRTGQLDESVNARTQMMGREGNVLLVGGNAATRQMSVVAGERRLWRLVNAANARYFQLELGGGEMIRVGGDRGWLQSPEPVSQLLLVPGERAEILVRALPNQTATLRLVPMERAMGAGATEPYDLVRLVPTGAAVTPMALPAVLQPFQGAAAPILTRDVTVDESMGSMGGMGNMGSGSGGAMMHFTINGQSYPNVPVLHATLGTVERWDVDVPLPHSGACGWRDAGYDRRRVTRRSRQRRQGHGRRDVTGTVRAAASVPLTILRCADLAAEVA